MRSRPRGQGRIVLSYGKVLKPYTDGVMNSSFQELG